MPDPVEGDPTSLDYALETTKRWVAFGVANAARADKADERYRVGIGIVEQCETRDREAVKKSKRWF